MIDHGRPSPPGRCRVRQPYHWVRDELLTLAKAWIANGPLVGRLTLRLAPPLPFAAACSPRTVFACFRMYAMLRRHLDHVQLGDPSVAVSAQDGVRSDATAQSVYAR